ncbi:MAG: HD domain-containing phosphohydrolase [Planctomycetota bacterium]
MKKATTSTNVVTEALAQCAASEKKRQSEITSRVMIVDDEPINIKVTRKYLQSAGYTNFLTSTDATTVVEDVIRDQPDIVLLDVVMPGISGLDILSKLRKLSNQTPILILTASADPKTKLAALELGATDFLSKPVDPSELVLRVRNVISTKAHRDHLERIVADRTRELARSQREVVQCLARAAEFRDEDTGHHIVRVGKIAAVIARTLNVSPRLCAIIEQASQLHDVGKIAVPDQILHKPAKLTPEEFAEMKNHCVYGHKILQKMSKEEYKIIEQQPRAALSMIDTRSSELLQYAARIAITHHEWWDGSGYPNGLKGEEIPLEGRITAVADVFDALSSKRPYKSAFSLESCLELMKKNTGTQFDPTVIAAFLKSLPTIEKIRSQLAD